jgi:hypothetical protein
MEQFRLASSLAAMALFATLLVGAGPPTAKASDPGSPSAADCKAQDDLTFLCDMLNPEDLVLLPGGRWILNGQYQPSPTAGTRGPLRLIDTKTRSWRAVKPVVSKASRARANDKSIAQLGKCRTPPDFSAIAAHGIGLRRPKSGPPIVYVINHDTTERIEAFEVHKSKNSPQFSWIGCLEAPGKLHFNSVAITPGGTVFATVLLADGQMSREIHKGSVVGGVYRLASGDTAFSRLALSLSGPNGIEVSPDGKTIFIVEMGKKRVHGYSLADLNKPIGTAELTWFWPLSG